MDCLWETTLECELVATVEVSNTDPNMFNGSALPWWCLELLALGRPIGTAVATFVGYR